MNRKEREERKDNGDCKTQEGPGVLDRAVEPQHRRDHLPKDQGQVQPLDQAPHAQDHEADRQYQRDAEALCGY